MQLESKQQRWKNGRYRIRTCDPLIKSQLHQNDKHIQNKDLHETQSTAYKPAYKEIQKQGEINALKLPSDLAEIVAAWPKLPNEIISVIMTIIRASIAQ